MVHAWIDNPLFPHAHGRRCYPTSDGDGRRRIDILGAKRAHDAWVRLGMSDRRSKAPARRRWPTSDVGAPYDSGAITREYVAWSATGMADRRGAAPAAANHPVVTLSTSSDYWSVSRRAHYALQAPIDRRMVESVYGGPVPADDAGRRAFMGVWALLQFEHADAMIAEENARGVSL